MIMGKILDASAIGCFIECDPSEVVFQGMIGQRVVIRLDRRGEKRAAGPAFHRMETAIKHHPARQRLSLCREMQSQDADRRYEYAPFLPDLLTMAHGAHPGKTVIPAGTKTDLVDCIIKSPIGYHLHYNILGDDSTHCVMIKHEDARK